ncbi:MAG TPA: hypothetical protein VIJ19_00795 [Opitutaceae bacterium]
MKASRERIFLGPNWHVDCRLVAELPEDSVVGIRFITYAISCGIALSVLLFTGWYAYTDISLRHQIEDGTLHLEDDRWEVIEITRLQRFYEIESRKIESAYKEMKNPVLISSFVSRLGHQLPERTVIDTIEYNDGVFIVRGRIRETSERASIALGGFLEALRKDPDVGPHCNSINVTALDRSVDDEQMMTYSITFHLKERTL